jgi:hypothetical protein
MNAEWHKQHVLPKGAPVGERIVWHREPSSAHASATNSTKERMNPCMSLGTNLAAAVQNAGHPLV